MDGLGGRRSVDGHAGAEASQLALEEHLLFGVGFFVQQGQGLQLGRDRHGEVTRGGMGGQSRQAPPMVGGMGYGYGMPMIMPMPMFSPFGFGFGFGGLSFIFNILIFLWVANFFLSFVSSLTAGNDKRNDDDRF